MPTLSSTTGGAAGFSSLSQDVFHSDYNAAQALMLVDALELNNFDRFFDAFCVTVVEYDTECKHGYCPNSDIAGIFVRVATYITNFFVATILFHNREGLGGAVFPQILWVYSLALTSAWTALRHHITRIHATLAFLMAASPVTLYIYFYALVSLVRKKHRLDPIIGPGQIWARFAILLSMVLLAVGLTGILLNNSFLTFQQEACEKDGIITIIASRFFLNPFRNFGQLPAGTQIVLTSVLLTPVVSLILAWLYAFFRCFRARHRNSETNMFEDEDAKNYTSTWAMMRERYKLLHLITLVILPTSFWIMFIEVGIHFGTPHDNRLQTSFGQVLAMFVAIPPILTTMSKASRVREWYHNLFLVTWYRSRKSRQKEPALPMTHQDLSSSSSVDTVVEKDYDSDKPTLAFNFGKDLPEIRIIPFDSSFFDAPKESDPSRPKDNL